MSHFLQIKHANDYALNVGAEVLHPFVSIIHFDELGEIRRHLYKVGVYAIFVHDHIFTEASYGIGGYDMTKGSLTAVSPGQIIGSSDEGHTGAYHGWALFFDTEFMRGTLFEERLVDYHYFSYNVNEALQTTDEEKQTMWHLMEMIRTMLATSIRTPSSDRILQDYIVLVCDYCLSFYQRQFHASVQQQSDVLSRFQMVLNDYYDKRMQYKYGLPNVKYCASKLNLSTGYFADVIRSATGECPMHVIQRYLIDYAKSLLVHGQTVTQVANQLGFEYPQHFTRFFKKHTNLQPSKYVKSLKIQYPKVDL